MLPMLPTEVSRVAGGVRSDGAGPAVLALPAFPLIGWTRAPWWARCGRSGHTQVRRVASSGPQVRQRARSGRSARLGSGRSGLPGLPDRPGSGAGSRSRLRRRDLGADHGRAPCPAWLRPGRTACPLYGPWSRGPVPPAAAAGSRSGQTSLPGQERRSGPVLRARRVPVGARILLVDDVVTTGTSLATASDALLAAGARSVRSVVVAATPAPGWRPDGGGRAHR